MSVAAIVVGCMNIDVTDIQVDDVTNPNSIASSCKAEPKIPYYMVVAGILMIVMMIIRLFLLKCCNKIAECGEENACCNTINALCRFSFGTLFDLVALGLIVAWLVVGTIWTFNIWSTD